MRKMMRATVALLCLSQFSRAGIPEEVHPDYSLAELRMPVLFKTMGLAFLPDGTMVLASIDLIGGGEEQELNVNEKVYLIKGASPDSLPSQIKEVSNFWRQLSGVVVAEGRVYVSDREGFYQIPDLMAPVNLAANRRQVALWPNENHWNFGAYWHQWVFTPQYLNGSFYAPYSGSIRSGGWSNADPTTRFSGAFLKWDLSGNLQAYAGGLRSPNGANFDAATGEMFVTDNQGSWLPASTFMRIRKDRFYGHRQSSPDVDSAGKVLATHAPNFAEGFPYDPPVAWLPHGTVRSSPSQPIQLHRGTFAGDWLIGDVNNPGLVRVALDKVGDEYNGAVFRFSMGTGNSAINRMAEDPQGGIVIGTIAKISGNWPSGDNSPLYRLTAKSPGSAFDIKSMRALNDGLELTFTQPVNPDSIRVWHFTVKSARYVRQREYGLGKQPDEDRGVLGAEASADRKRVHLKLDSMPLDRVYYLKVDGVPSSGGKALWNPEAWFTYNYASGRGWDSETSVLSAAVTPSRLIVNALPEGSTLEVRVRCGSSAGGCGEGSRFQARLLTPAGKVLAMRSGAGADALRFSRPGNGSGVYLLQILSPGAGQGNLSVTQRIVF